MRHYYPHPIYTTRFLCPTNYRGSRVKAISPSGESLTLTYDHALDGLDNHIAAALALMAKQGKSTEGRIICCDTQDSRGYLVAIIQGQE